MIFTKLFLIAAFVCVALGDPDSATEVAVEPVTILSQENTIAENGNFHWSFEAGDGSKSEQDGTFDGEATEEVVHGSYEYTGNDGKTYKVSYVADAGGFQPEGEHIPQVPPLIQRALEYLATLPPPEKEATI
ncbi:hypothetical protein NQ314_011743 [Rhamnusium bicolor]|uniref:Uncharacterized protein n=1 Tax=Rhamnusium bicolor TaxID=1586634 RepID=A0AAV8XGF1_9CUCU|nr:hypothetical protein NQ314_020281 [Rhamnusium bicolor]KAJ8937723.1 hypothetical protein NQ314_011743 [Rhamnusium bicolor]